MATKARTRKTSTAAAQRKAEERKALAARLAALEESYEYDDDNPTQRRTFESLTQHYSEGNALLIMAQADALGVKVRKLDDVGGFRAFADRGRSVKADEHKSIWIWAHAAKHGDESDSADTTAGEAEGKRREFYFPVGLFHVGQTEDKVKADARRAATQAAALSMFLVALVVGVVGAVVTGGAGV